MWFTQAAAGLAALAHSAQAVFAGVKYLGAAYLLYLAYRAWNMPVSNVATATRAIEQPPLQLFLGSPPLTLANPKTIAFFLALLPTVVHLESLTLSGFFAVVLAICVVLPFTLGCYVLLAARTRIAVCRARVTCVRSIAAPGLVIAGAAVAIATRYAGPLPELLAPMSASQDSGIPAAVKSAERLNTRAAGVVGLAVMCSRVLGLVREQVCAALFGGGGAMDAFTAAFRIPNLLRDLFAEGALSTAFVATFSKIAVRSNDAAAWRLANKIATMAAVLLGALLRWASCFLHSWSRPWHRASIPPRRR